MDFAYITEVDPLWNNDILSFIIHPESLLFSNPVAQLACVADSISTNMGISSSVLYWCVGSGGSAYPLTGHVNNDNYLQANETISARMVFLMGRLGLLCDPGIWPCSCLPTPVWLKQNYRTHIAKPVRDWWCQPFGRSSLLWGTLKNPPFIGDNFAWILFRKRVCCEF